MLVVASIGDPHDKETWSGTPKNIVNQLTALGIHFQGCSTELTRNQKLTAYGAYQLKRGCHGLLRPSTFDIPFRYRADYEQNGLTHRIHYHKVIKCARSLRATHILHMASGAHPQVHDGLIHAAVIDTTWNLNRNTIRADQRFGTRIFKKILETEAQAFHNMSHLFPISEYVRNDLVKFYGVAQEKVTVIGTGMGQPFPGRDKNYASNTILFTAKLRFEEKGGQLLLDAFQLVRALRPNTTLILVGQDWYPHKFAGLPGVEAYGHVSLELLQDLFARASLFAMPALVEPWGLVYLEALANGLPVLGLRRMALPEITVQGRYGFLVDQATPEAVAGGLMDALSDPQRLQRMGMEGKEACLSRYSWGRAAAAIQAWAQGSLSTDERI